MPYEGIALPLSYTTDLVPKETARTLDLPLTGRLLCQLSYMGYGWYRRRVLRSRPRAYRARALPLSYFDEKRFGVTGGDRTHAYRGHSAGPSPLGYSHH